MAMSGIEGAARATGMIAELVAAGAAAAAAKKSAGANATKRAQPGTTKAAAKTPAAKKSSGSTKVTARGQGEVQAAKTGYAKTSTASAEYAFLKDASLSAEEKLILLLAKQSDQLEKQINATLNKVGKGTTATKKKSVFKVLDLVKTVIPALGLTDKVMGGKLGDLLKQLSGPVLAAAATVAGFPALAPAAASLGPKLADAILDAEVPSSIARAAGDEGSASKATAPNPSGELSKEEMARLQLLIDRQKEWAAMVSNLMQSLHQTRMSVIQNLR